MRNFTYCLLFLVFACGAKRTQSNLASGNYNEANEIATDHLRNNKDKKGKQEFIYMLEEAFAKAKERDLMEIGMLKKENNPANLEKIYNAFQRLNNRQEKIRPLLPLRLLNEKRDAFFPFDSYTDEILSSKAALSEYLYGNSVSLLKSGNKMDARKVYEDLQYLNRINPNYKDVKKLLDEAQFKGTDFVNVYLKNETNMIIPSRLEDDLLDFSTYGLDDKWTAYHSRSQKDIDYDYGLAVNFRNINISPEQNKEREFTNEREIKVGTKKLVDRRGHVVLDSLGHPIMVDDMRLVKIKVKEVRQFKACQVTAKVDYVDLKKDQLIQTFPLASEFIFENIYAVYKGDKRALDESYYPVLDRRPIPFPIGAQMVYDTGEDLKSKLKKIISDNRFRR
ncbi:MAG TPA: hypothetical protein VGB43_06005 [Flavobacterium sp.]